MTRSVAETAQPVNNWELSPIYREAFPRLWETFPSGWKGIALLVKESRNPSFQQFQPAALTFPDNEHTPPLPPERSLIANISLTVSIQFGCPELATACGTSRISTARMLMPEAPMNKDDFLMPWKNQIGLSRQVFAMQTEAIAHPVHE